MGDDATGQVWERVVGQSVFAVLVARPSFSFMRHVYSHIHDSYDAGLPV